jgi:translation initiation factor 2B subunit (eIF-2B alpha/beta/delta family)
LVLALAVLTNFAAGGLSPFESISISLFWLIGVVFFLYDWYALRSFLRGKIGDEVSLLSEILESRRKQLIDLVSKNEEKENEGQICLLSNVLDIIDKERERIQQYKIKLIDSKTIILFAGFSALSLIAILKGSGEDGRSSTAVFVIDNARPLIDDGINYVGHIGNYLYQFLPK